VSNGADTRVRRSKAQSNVRQIPIDSLGVIAKPRNVIDGGIRATRLGEPAYALAPKPDRICERAADEKERSDDPLRHGRVMRGEWGAAF
jgi:hypothetical protein